MVAAIPSGEWWNGHACSGKASTHSEALPAKQDELGAFFMLPDDLAWRGRHETRSRSPLLAVLAVLTLAFVLSPSMSEPVRADSGSLETQKGGLFHRKGWISPDIYRPKPQQQKKKASKRVARTSRPRRATSNANRRTARRRIPRNVVKRRERQITRRTKRASKPVRVASLTTTVPSVSTATGPELRITGSLPRLPIRANKPMRVASLTTTVPSVGTATGPELSITGGSPRLSISGGSPRINWRANRRCLAARLRAAINHVARHYGRVRVNSTCRSRRHNRRVGGARRSYHIGGRAADIRVFGNVRAASRYLRRVSGGYKHYGGGRFHVDTGPRRTW